LEHILQITATTNEKEFIMRKNFLIAIMLVALSLFGAQRQNVLWEVGTSTT
jgi:hypothetical protein